MVVSWVEQAPQDHTQLEGRSSPLPEKRSGSTAGGGGGSSLGTRSSFLPGAKRSCAFFRTTGPWAMAPEGGAADLLLSLEM